MERTTQSGDIGDVVDFITPAAATRAARPSIASKSTLTRADNAALHREVRFKTAFSDASASLVTGYTLVSADSLNIMVIIGPYGRARFTLAGALPRG